MSRRAPSGPDRTEQNRATLKSLVKLESNKSCADCKRNKHPRWASWNLGVFVCIRCSGIHRGMGTHISRVKSVDLDSWTDEQMANMLKWGNARANRYWENKLAEGHVPNEAKIENFIRTKYDSKRWAMDGPMPDPSTLDVETDDDVPLNVVRDKAIERERTGSVRSGSGSGTVAPPPTRKATQNVDLFGDDDMTAPVRPSSTGPAVQRPPVQKAAVAPPKQTKPGESLLGLDFLGGTQAAAPARPSSTGPSTPGVPGRADLKSSILSLYASKPAAPQAPPPQPQQQSQSTMDMFAGMSSPPLASPPVQQQQSSQFGGMNDAFSSLSFASPQQPAAKPSPFANLTSPTAHTRQTSATKSSLSGGSFFDAKPAPAKPTSPPAQPQTTRKESFGDWGDFSSAASPPPPATNPVKSPPATSSNMGDLFDMSAPSPPPKPPVQPARQPSFGNNNNNAFNLSSQQPPKPSSPPLPQATNFSSLSNMDAWGSNDAWATPDPAPAAPAQNTSRPAPPPMQTPFDSGWGDVASPGGGSGSGPKVQQDEEFGGWSHASPVAASKPAPPTGGFGAGGGSDDLFGNVWE